MLAHDIADLEVHLPPQGALLLSTEGDELAGMVFPARIREDTVQLRRMCVRPAHRRQGLGGALVAAVLTAAREIGYERVLLESPRSWAESHAVYRAHGVTAVDPCSESEVPEHLREHWIHLGRDL